MRGTLVKVVLLLLLILCGSTIVYVSNVLRGDGGKPGELVVEESELSWPPEDDRLKATPLQYRLKNSGSTDVRIKRIVSGCGCTVPSLTKTLVRPGEMCEVLVPPLRTEIVSAERVVPITLFTDSPLTPQVALSLRLVDRRPPPFLVTAGGTVTFHDPSPGKTTQFAVKTVEEFHSEPSAPDVTSPDPYIQLKYLDIEQQQTERDARVVYRTYKYAAELIDPLPSDNFHSAIRVRDPFAPGHEISVLVKGTAIPPVRIQPAKLVLDASGERSRPTPTRMMVVTNFTVSG